MLINLTPHDIRIRTCSSTVAEPDPSDLVLSSTGSARVGTRSTAMEPRDGVPVIRTEYTAVEGLPEPAEGTTYIVSLLVCQALPMRRDLVGPATGPSDGTIRDAQGRIYAVRALQFWA